MPGYDKSGPQGQGSMSGRRQGLCSGNTTVEELAQSTEAGFGRGAGRRHLGGRGQGLGRGQGGGRGQGLGRGQGRGRAGR